MSTLNVVIATDNHYLPIAAICVKSLFATNDDFKHIKVHLLGNGLSPENIKKFSTVFEGYKYELYIYSISDIETRLQVQIPKTIAVTAYARLFIGSILPQEIENVLYVDCDVIFNGSIFDFYNSDLGDNLVGGVLDTFMNSRAKDEIGISSIEPYLNSGVLLIPLKKWREQDLEHQFIQFLLKHGGNVYHHDQGIINAVCKGKKKIFPPQYNTSSFYFSHPFRVLAKRNTPFYKKNVVKLAKKNPIIIHFTCGYLNRPWIKNCKHPFAKLFCKYKQQTVFASMPFLEDMRSSRERLDSFVFLNFPFIIFRLYSKIADNSAIIKKMMNL